MAPDNGEARKPPILIGFSEISGYFHSLTRGLSEHGYSCYFAELVPHPFDYQDRKSSDEYFVSLIKRVKQKREKTRSKVEKKSLFLLSGILMVPFFFKAISRYEVFIFTNGNSFFLFNLDLILLKLFNKKVIMPFLGSEARPSYLDGFQSFSDVKEMFLSCRKQKRKIRFIERFVDVIINNPAASHFQTKPFVSGHYLGIPQAFEDLLDSKRSETLQAKELDKGSPSSRTPIKILHTPSDRVGKGSDTIRKVVNNLIEKKFKIEYTELSNRPHKEIIEAIRRSDLIIDQVYSDTPMAAVASEAAWFGVPAVVGGYYADTINQDMDRAFIAPTLYVLPQEIESAVESLILNSLLRRELGESERNFVRNRWSRKEVASRYSRIISDDIPREWLFDPRNTTYLYGCGLSREQVVARISSLIDRYGLGSLGLKGKDKLEQSFLELTDSENMTNI